MKDQLQEIIDSGYVPLYKGEPPFMTFKGGFGFQGVLLQHIKSGKVQCHLCGELLHNIGRHLRASHPKTPAREYRIKTGLNFTTPLCSPQVSEARLRSWNQQSPEKKAKAKKILAEGNIILNKKRKSSKGLKRNVQMKNKVGSCDLQIKTRVLKMYDTLGRLPTTAELQEDKGLYSLVWNRFGTYDKALEAWGFDNRTIEERKKASKDKHLTAVTISNKLRALHSEESLIKAVRVFAYKWGRIPSQGDLRKRVTHQQNLPHYSTYHRYFGDKAMETIVKACTWPARLGKARQLLGIRVA